MPIEFTDWATDILQRTYEAARRLNPDASVRMARSGAGVVFTLTDEREAGDTLVQGEGFDLLVQEGLEPHDQLVLRPPGSSERSEREPH